MSRKKTVENQISEALARRMARIAERKSASDGKSETVSAERFDPRSAPRNPAYRQAILVFGMGERLPVVIKNLSNSGAMISFFVKVPLTEKVELREATLGARKALVIWQLPGEAGLRFETEGES